MPQVRRATKGLIRYGTNRNIAFVPAAGYYKTNYRALRLRELARWNKRGLASLPRLYLIARFKPPSDHGVWMPGLWADGECNREYLSERFWQATAPIRQALEQLGFTECGYLKVTKHLNPDYRDSGAIFYLDQNRCHVGTLHYVKIHMLPPVDAEREQILIGFTAVFERDTLSYSNNRDALDPLPQQTVVRLTSIDPNFIYQRFLQHVHQRPEAPRRFPDTESLHKWFDARAQEVFEERVRRGLYIRMTDDEIDAARQRMRCPPVAATSRASSFKVKLGLGIVFVLALIAVRLPRHSGADSTMEYRGEVFRLAKAYPSYEDYKDDPNNLDTNELARIEKTMVTARIPSSFKSRDEFFHFMIFNLEFPGYGMGGIEGHAQTDDGSTLLVESIEIPQRDKERVVAMREFGGKLNLLDDFVYGSASNVLKNAKLEGKTLRYHDKEGTLIREKNLN